MRRTGTSHLFLAALLLAFVSGCSTVAPRTEREAAPDKPPAAPSAKRSGGYYLDDGPGDNPPPNLEAIPDAEPKVEPLHKFANNPYTVLGQTYVPDTRRKPYKARGIASWYGRKFHGQKTSSGEIYDMYGMTAAHPTLPLPSYARVTNVRNGKAVVVRINDRGPFHSSRLIDLSYTAAYKLGIVQNGSAQVEVESIDPAGDPRPAEAASSKPAPEGKEAAIPITAERGGVFLQLGAFGTRENAENFRAKLLPELGSLADVLHISAANGLFRVRLGPYASRSEAGDAAAQVRQAVNIAPVVAVR
ncbi:MAG: septal ring lytic transglycosylase RlpA family protein [Pseudomonadota bacterium]